MAPHPILGAASRRLGPRGPRVVGVVNVTPDSFSDGGRYLDPQVAIAHGVALVEEGADWLDVGGESTRPGAQAPGVQEEQDRVLPVLEGLARAVPDVVCSVDTRRGAVARAALAAGAGVVNDVSGGRDPDLLAAGAEAGAVVVLGHLRGTPDTMQADTRFGDLTAEVLGELLASVAAAERAGVPRHHLVADPGLGFGKAPRDNPRLFGLVPRLQAEGLAVMIGASRKRFVGELTGQADPALRVHGSLGAAVAAMVRGADFLRVHDVRATIDALRVARACLDGELADVAE
ncbi:MAG: dihydropteroate synthase [Alphaproteobacteria bacterium]|nr:dihydropteroate synthase [Alphaproteobacteria bacterium]